MATTVEITVAGIILFTNTIAVAICYYVGNAILSPFLDFIAQWPIHPLLQASMWETSYIFPAFFGLLLIFEVLSIVGFAVVITRRQVTPFDY